nr:hypothetical protein [Tanacetum cinerariifolium]
VVGARHQTGLLHQKKLGGGAQQPVGGRPVEGQVLGRDVVASRAVLSIRAHAQHTVDKAAVLAKIDRAPPDKGPQHLVGGSFALGFAQRHTHRGVAAVHGQAVALVFDVAPDDIVEGAQRVDGQVVVAQGIEAEAWSAQAALLLGAQLVVGPLRIEVAVAAFSAGAVVGARHQTGLLHQKKLGGGAQ